MFRYLRDCLCYGRTLSSSADCLFTSLDKIIQRVSQRKSTSTRPSFPMSSSLYQFSADARATIRKFRISTSRSETLQILPIKIEPKPSYQITIDEEELDELKEVTELDELAEVLPDNSPRYLLTAYPLTTKDNIKQVPLFLIYWKPPTVVSQEWKMLYAGALEQVRAECGTYKLIEVTSGLEDDDDVEELKQKLQK